jgi:Na+-transporting NADH:ubiquinone oxidoreductase subunit NqrB
MTATQSRAVRIGERDIPVVLPNRRDPRLHLAAVIITVHTIGITALGFEVSVPQILTAIVTAGLIDVGFTLARDGRLVWPASGMLTGSGVALILRYAPTGSGHYWSWEGWYWFALVAGTSVLSKYLLRWRGSHVFNPSNLGLVLIFLVVSGSVLEPLDFWWSPLDFWMLLAYAVIIGGGVIITRRLRLLEMAAVFWFVLVAGLGVLAASGHCMIATWSTTPVCGGRFWATLSTSPEILIFLFFMITDPKTIPRGRAARVAFAASLAAFTTLMIAPHTLEYGAKVGLLASLVIWSPLRYAFDRVLPAGAAEVSGIGILLTRLGRPAGAARSFTRGLTLGSTLMAFVVTIVLAGSPAREAAIASPSPDQAIAVQVDPATLPPVTIDPSVERLNMDLDKQITAGLALNLAENLALEGQAIRYADVSRLALADGGERLGEIQARLEEAVAEGARPVDHHVFDSLHLRAAGESEGQTSAALAFDAAGTIEQVIHDPSGSVLSRSSRPFQATFVMRQLGGDRWSIVRVIED